MSETVIDQEQKTTTTPAEEPRALTRTPISLGLAPLELDAAWRFAKMLASSSMVPKQFQDKPEDVLVAIQYGVEVGLPPMASLQSISVINGRPGLWGDGLLSIVVSSAAYVQHEEYFVAAGERCQSLLAKDLERDDTKAVARFWRKGQAEPFVGEFSISDAKKAGLWTKDGPWKSYPARMLKMRARGYAVRDGFSDALRGLKAAEELADMPPDIVVESAAPPAEPVRRSEKPAPIAEPGVSATEEASTVATGSSETAPAEPAKRTTRKPESKSQPGNGPSVTTENMVVTETAYVAPKGQDPFWEIKATATKSGEPPVEMTFVTRDEATFKFAASCEGTGVLVNVAWHGGKRPDGSSCKILESIVAAN